MAQGSYADEIKHWGEMTVSVEANPELGPRAQEDGAKLTVELVGLKGAIVRQSGLRAQVQETTREIEGYLERGREIATRLRDTTRGFYGREAEKLAEFGLQPRRPVVRSKEESKDKKKPSEPGSTPAQTAAPSTGESK